MYIAFPLLRPCQPIGFECISFGSVCLVQNIQNFTIFMENLPLLETQRNHLSTLTTSNTTHHNGHGHLTSYGSRSKEAADGVEGHPSYSPCCSSTLKPPPRSAGWGGSGTMLEVNRGVGLLWRHHTTQTVPLRSKPAPTTTLHLCACVG